MTNPPSLLSPVERTNFHSTFHCISTVRMDYFFEEEQILRFDVYDEDKKGSRQLKHHDILGSCTMVIGEIVHEPGTYSVHDTYSVTELVNGVYEYFVYFVVAISLCFHPRTFSDLCVHSNVLCVLCHIKGMIMAKKLMHKGRALRNRKTKKYSSLVATVEQVNQAGNQLVTMQFSAKELPKMDGLFGKADPYFVIQRAREDGKWVTVYGNRENHIKKSLNPCWKSFEIESQTLCKFGGSLCP